MIAHLLQKTKRAKKAARSFPKLFLLAGLFTGCWTVTAVAQSTNSATLAWDPSSSAGITGYRLYQGTTSQNYTVTYTVGNLTNATASGLTAGTTYYFAVTALDTNGLESAFSSEIAYTVPTSAAPTPTPSPTPTPTPSPTPTNIVSGLDFVASAGTVTAPFALSNGILSQTVDTGVTNGGRAVYSFSVASGGDYLLYANVLAPSTAANSFYVNIDADPTDPEMIWDVPSCTSFTNQAVAWRGNGTTDQAQFAPKVFNLTAGTHQLIVIGREANTQVSAFSFQPVAGLSAPWVTSDIGNPGMTGSASSFGGLYTVSGAGNLSGRADNFRVLYQPMSGNGEIRAQVTSLQNTTGNARAGVMVRETLTPGSEYAFLGIAPDNSYRFQTRNKTSGNTGASTVGSAAASNAWVRLVRTGNTLASYTSTDGATWKSTGSKAINMATNVYVGLAVASGSTNTLSTSTFTNVVVVP